MRQDSIRKNLVVLRRPSRDFIPPNEPNDPIRFHPFRQLPIESCFLSAKSRKHLKSSFLDSLFPSILDLGERPPHSLGVRAILTMVVISLCSPILAQEHAILCGGPALRKWEELRVEKDRHDRWWANFIRASTLRMDELRKAYHEQIQITWIVYRDGYAQRGQEDKKPYLRWIEEQALKRQVKLVWFSTSDQAINALNSLNQITTFDYFGHSNRYCFMLDYGSDVMAVSQVWLHQNDLQRIRRRIFSPNAFAQSWGCHTGESMSAAWRQRFGFPLVGAKGKTDYSVLSQGELPTVTGKWIR